MATKKDKPATKTAKASKPAAKKGATAKAAAPKKTTAKKAPAKKPAAKKPGGDGAVGDAHEKVQLWKDGPYWATTNIGAEKPEDSGYYFWWGDTVGYKREKDKWVATDGSSSDFSFEESNTPTIPSGDEDCDEDQAEAVVRNRAFLKDGGWITNNGVLVPEHDAAHVQWGGGWRMPTSKELQDLCHKCLWTWKNVNGVEGYVVRGYGDYASSSIFLPCTGFVRKNSLHGCDSSGNLEDGYYWSSVPQAHVGLSNARGLHFYSEGWVDEDSLDDAHNADHDFPRSDGLPIRPVQGFTK